MKIYYINDRVSFKAKYGKLKGKGEEMRSYFLHLFLYFSSFGAPQDKEIFKRNECADFFYFIPVYSSRLYVNTAV